MCGRYTLREPELVDEFDELSVASRFNIAPAQGDYRIPVLKIVEGGVLQAAMMQWWLLPHWSRTRTIKYSTFNATIEGLETKASFKTSFRKRRCLIPADGFFEWWKDGKARKPHFVHHQDNALFYFAGLWDIWESPEETVESCTIVTTPANALLKSIHHRCPAILPAEHRDAWLDPSVNDTDCLKAMIVPFDPKPFAMYEVGRFVSNARNDGPDCITPLSA